MEPGLFPLLPHTHIPCSCNVPAYTLELAPRKLAGARKQVWCRLFPSWSSEGAIETLGVAIRLLTPLLLPHKSTGAAPQPLSSGSSHALRTAPGSGQTARVPGANWETFREGCFSVPTARGSSNRKVELEIRGQAEQSKVWALQSVRAFHLTEHTDTMPMRRESLQRGSLSPSADSPAVPELHLDPP